MVSALITGGYNPRCEKPAQGHLEKEKKISRKRSNTRYYNISPKKIRFPHSFYLYLHISVKYGRFSNIIRARTIDWKLIREDIFGTFFLRCLIVKM